MANLLIKYRIDENFIHNQDDFQVTSLKGNFEVNFFIRPAFYPSALGFCPSTLAVETIPY